MNTDRNVICAWCTAPVSGEGDRPAHGICLGCAMHFLKKLPQAYLASIAEEDGTVSLFSGHKLRIEAAQAS